MERLILALLLSLILTLPAEAKFHPLKFARRATAITVGVVAFPVAAPANWVVQTAAAHYYLTKGNWRMSHYMIQGREYDWLWLENW